MIFGGGRRMYRVLLVDDEQIERMALAKKIDRYYGDKVEIYHAVNGREAVAMCGEHEWCNGGEIYKENGRSVFNHIPECV